MAAFTEGFSSTVDYNEGPGHMGAAISKVLAARKFARQEREVAEEKAKKAGYDSLEELGVEKGYFFKAALKSKFGGSYITGKKQDIKQAVDRVKLLKNPKAQFWNFVDNRDADGKAVKTKNATQRFREQFDNYNFVSAERPPEDVEPQEEKVPNTGEETAEAASGSKQRVSREDILSAVNKIAASLEKTAQSINNNVKETKDVATGVQAIKTDVINQLSQRTDSIEDKLDKIAAAINEQTALAKSETDKKEGAADINRQDDKLKVSDTFSADDLTTKEDESLDDQFEGLGEDMSADSPQYSEDPEEDDVPRAETGGIISGPDSGYLAELHGDEMVIPLDNNYTQGEASAVDGKVRPVPQEAPPEPQSPVVNNNYNISTPQFEQGTPRPQSSLGGKVGFTPMNLPSLGGGETDRQVQLLQDAMKLVFMVPGGAALAATTQLASSVDNAEASSQIAQVARPLAQAFGLPSTLVSKAKGGKVTGEGRAGSGDADGNDEKKGVFASLGQALKNLFGGNRSGRPGSPGPDSGPVSIPTGNPMATNEEQEAYAGEIYQMAVSAGAKHPEIAAGVAALETGWGTKEHGNNPFNMRGLDGNFLTFATRQDAVDEFVRLWDKNHSGYKNLESYEDPLEAWAGVVHSYAPASDGNNPEAYVQFMADFLANKVYEKSSSPQSPEPPPVSEPPPATPPKTGQQISETFGLQTHEKRRFMHDNVLYEAYKTTKGFDFYRLGGRLFGGAKIEPGDPTLPDVTKSFIKSMRSNPNIKPPAGEQASLQPVSREIASLQGPSASERAQTIAMINNPTNTRQTAATGSQPTNEGTIEEGRDHSLHSYYNLNSVVG
jgi:hypothetical protein